MRMYIKSSNKYAFFSIIDYLKKIIGTNPIVLPKKITRLTLLKSPIRYKKHLQQIETRVYKCFFEIKKLPSVELNQFTDIFIYFK